MRKLLIAALLLAPVPAQAAPANDLGPLLSNQIVRCWNPPAGATGSITVRFDLDQAGRVTGTPKVNGLANAGVAKAAVNAINLCQPYRMPAARFTDWQHAKVTLSTGG